jgi:hypothetical protein
MELNNVMSKEESIGLAETLAKKYYQVSQMTGEVNNVKEELERAKKQSEKPVARYSAFKYFWPYLIAAVVAEILVVVLGGIILSSGTYTNSAYSAYSFFKFATPVAIIIIGLVLAIRKRNSLNRVAVESHSTDLIREKKLEEDLEAKKKRIAEFKDQIKEYDDLVPEKLRQKIFMEKVKKMLESGEADDFADAIAKIGKK